MYAKHGKLSRRLVWGLVHSERNTDVGRGLEFAEELLRDKSIDGQDQRDLVYLTAVAMYRLGRVRPCSLPDRHGSVQLNIQSNTLHRTSWYSCCVGQHAGFSTSYRRPRLKLSVQTLKCLGSTRCWCMMLQVLDARRQLEELLKVNPQWRQAQTLKAAVDDQVVREGLLGLGVATAIGGVAALILAAALGGRR